MTDKMPATGQASNFAALRFPLLHAIFAEMNHAGVECIANVGGGAGFRNADQRNFVFRGDRPPAPRAQCVLECAERFLE